MSKKEKDQILGRVLLLGDDWAEVEACGEIRRLSLAPNLFLQEGSIVRIRGSRIVSAVGTSELSPPADLDECD